MLDHSVYFWFNTVKHLTHINYSFCFRIYLWVETELLLYLWCLGKNSSFNPIDYPIGLSSSKTRFFSSPLTPFARYDPIDYPIGLYSSKNRFFSSTLIPFDRYGTSKKAVTPRTRTTSSWATTSIAAKSLWKRSCCCSLTKLNIQKISFFSEGTTSVQDLTGQFYHQH